VKPQEAGILKGWKKGAKQCYGDGKECKEKKKKNRNGRQGLGVKPYIF